MALILGAVYRDGARVAQPTTVAQALDARADGETVVLALDSPDLTELGNLPEELHVPPALLAEAPQEHARAGSERYDGSLVVQLRPATYDDAREEVEFGQVRAVVGTGIFLVVTYGRGEDVELVRSSLREAEKQAPALMTDPVGLLYDLFESVTDSYLPVMRGLDEDIDQIEEELFAGHPGVSRRIYELFNEVIDFQRAARPFLDVIDDVERVTDAHFAGSADDDGPHAVSRRRLRRVRERITRAVERSDAFRAQLQNGLGVNQALVAQQQNEDMKRISGWGAILFAPTLVGAIYGMNFAVMPELHWRLGYPYALGLMVVLTIGFYTVFKIKKWF